MSFETRILRWSHQLVLSCVLVCLFASCATSPNKWVPVPPDNTVAFLYRSGYEGDDGRASFVSQLMMDNVEQPGVNILRIPPGTHTLKCMARIIDSSGYWDSTEAVDIALDARAGHSYLVCARILEEYKGRKCLAQVETKDISLIEPTYSNDTARTKTLIAEGADPNGQLAYGASALSGLYRVTPLGLACQRGNIEVINLLLAANAKTDMLCSMPDEEETFFRILSLTPLGIACAKGNAEVVKVLLASKVDVNAICVGVPGLGLPEGNGAWTPLHIAAHFGHLEVTKLLVDNGADVFAVEKDKPLHKATPSKLARKSGHTEVADYLESIEAQHPPKEER